MVREVVDFVYFLFFCIFSILFDRSSERDNTCSVQYLSMYLFRSVLPCPSVYLCAIMILLVFVN